MLPTDGTMALIHETTLFSKDDRQTAFVVSRVPPSCLNMHDIL